MTAWKTLTGVEIIALAEARHIIGKGSHAKLRFVVLEIPESKAELFVEQALRAAMVRGKLTSSEASRTCTGERWISDGLVGLKGIPAMVYKHVRTDVFNPATRLEFA